MIDVEKIGERDNTYEDFLEDILKKDGEKDDCRFASKLACPAPVPSSDILIFQFTTMNTSSPPRELRLRLVREIFWKIFY